MTPELTLKRSFSESDLDLDSTLLQPRYNARFFSEIAASKTNTEQKEMAAKITAAKKAKKPNAILAFIASLLTTGSVYAFLITYCKIPSAALAAVLGVIGVGAGKVYYDADKAETVEAVEHQSRSDVKLGLKPETVSAVSVLVSVVSFADDPIPQSLLPDYVAVPLAIVVGFGVLVTDCWKNRTHPVVAMRNWWKNRRSSVIPQDESKKAVDSEIALQKWNKLSTELRAKIIALNDFTAERICGGVEALIFGSIIGGTAYATLITTFSFFSLAAIVACPPFAIGLVLALAVTTAALFYNRFMNGVKRAANQSLNEIRKTIGLKPVEIKQSSNPLIMVVATVLGVISLITSPIGKLVNMVTMAIGTAFVHFFALVGVKNRTVVRANLVAAVKKELAVADSKMAPPQLGATVAEPKVVVLAQSQSTAQKLISSNPSSFLRCIKHRARTHWRIIIWKI